MTISRRSAAVVAATAVLALLVSSSPTAPVAAADTPTKVRLAGGSLIPQLAIGLGAFKQEGLDVTMVKVDDFVKDDWLSTELLNKGQIDAEVNWFHRVVFGIGNNAPAKAVVLLEDTPGMIVMVANRAKDSIKSAADFRGKKIAEGAGFSTKSYLTTYMALKAGVPLHGYTPVAVESEGRREAIVKALKEGQVDVMSFMEPMTSSIMETKLVSPLYDLTTAEGTRKALGDVWPARCVYVAPSYIKAHPDTVQHLVNAFVRTMRFVNSHTAEEIAAKLPAGYWTGKNRAAETERIRKALPGFTKGDYSIPASAAKLVVEAIFSAPFDNSDEGRYRANAAKAHVKPEQAYDNQFVERAEKEIK